MASDANAKKYFHHLNACGGEAEILSLSQAKRYRLCMNSTGRCSDYGNIYRYQVRCSDGRTLSGPQVMYGHYSARVRDQRVRLQGDQLFYLGQDTVSYRTQDCLRGRDPRNRACWPVTRKKKIQEWQPYPVGYADIPPGVRVVEKRQAPPRPPPVSSNSSSANSITGLFTLSILLGIPAFVLWKVRGPILTTFYYYTLPHPLEEPLKRSMQAGTAPSDSDFQRVDEELQMAARNPYKREALSRRHQKLHRKYTDWAFWESKLKTQTIELHQDMTEAQVTAMRQASEKRATQASRPASEPKTSDTLDEMRRAMGAGKHKE